MSGVVWREGGEREGPAGGAVPEWARDAVWYQIFPERFRNGAPGSDPRAEDFGGPAGWRVRPWGMEWYARDAWEEGKAFWDTVFDRRFGGDLAGVREKLGYLADLGVDALYLNPVFWAPSLHKYDTRAYQHVDPSFGPDREGDLSALAAARETEDPATWVWTSADRALAELAAEAHRRGMRIILDGVFNHCGRAFFAFRDVMAKGRASRYAGWFRLAGERAGGGVDYEAWDGPNGSLPAYAREGDNLAEGVKRYLFAATRRWMDPRGSGGPGEGIDGWRLDVAFCVPHGFWREWHALVRSINPEAYTTGEIVGPAGEWVREGEFSAAMDYEWLFPTLSFFTPHPEAIGAAELRARMERLYARHSWATIGAMQNLLDSHDTGRILTMLESGCPPFAEWGPFFDWARVTGNAALRTSAPSAEAKRRLLLAAFWQFAGPGAPMIYYGTEVGLWGANDPCDRQSMPWDDIPAEDETLGFRGPLGARHSRAPDAALFAAYKGLIAMRKRERVLRRGGLRWLEGGGEEVLAFGRVGEGRVATVAIHRGRGEARLPLAVPPGEEIGRVGEGARWDAARGELVLPPLSAAAFARDGA